MRENEQKNQPLSPFGIAVSVVLILAVVLCASAVFQVLHTGYVNIAGFSMFRVVTGSMEPTIPVGTLLVCRRVDIRTVEQGDIVCFSSHQAPIYGGTVTHRVVGVSTDADGQVLLVTRGDANGAADGDYVDRNNFIGRVIWFTGDDSVLATVLAVLTDKVGFLGCIVFPCLLLAAFAMRECVRNIRKELENTSPPSPQAAQQLTADSLLSSMTPEEYEALVTQIREELMMEQAQSAAANEGEHHVEVFEEPGSERDKTE